MRSMILFLSGLCIITFLQSCFIAKSTLPHIDYTPALTEAGEVKADAMIKLCGPPLDEKFYLNPSVHLAYSPLKGWGLSGSYIVDRKNYFVSDYSFWSGWYETQFDIKADKLTIMTGYYHPAFKFSTWEVYGGYSKGEFMRAFNNGNQYLKEFQYRFHQFHLQPALVMKFQKKKLYLESSAALRINLLLPDKLNNSQQSASNLVYPHAQFLDHMYWSLTPNFHFSIGGSLFHYHLHTGIPIAIGQRFYASVVPININMGIGLRLAPEIWKR